MGDAMSVESTRQVMVMDAHAVGMLGVIRSLGRAGYAVHACAASEDALGLHSRYTAHAAVHPRYSSEDFIPWLLEYVESRSIALIMPSEGFLHAVSGRYDDVCHLLPDAVAPEIWRRCMSKVESYAALAAEADGAAHLPYCRVIHSAEELESLYDELGPVPAPYYVKGDAGKARSVGTDALVARCLDRDEAVAVLRERLPDYSEMICQGYATGKKVGVSLWRHNGEFRAENMTQGIHMNPFHGGMMSLRESFWHKRLLADAKRKMEILGWEGVAMMEYKWDPASDDFWFIEINARYWGYLHLDLFSGKDFPLLQARAFFGDAGEDMGPPVGHHRSRYLFPGDMGYLFSLLRSEDQTLVQKLKAIAGFVGWTLHPGCHADLWFPGDRGLYLRSLKRFFLP